MFEKLYNLEGIDAVAFYGANNSNLDKIRSYFPNMRIIARGHTLKAMGSEAQLKTFDDKLNLLLEQYHEFHSLSTETIGLVLNDTTEGTQKVNNPDVLIFGNTGKPITARTKNQQKLVDACNEKDLIFAIGPAGTGKTYTAIAMAVRALKNKEIRKVIISRPAVEAGERLGFLPGDLKEKIDPYLQPLYDALGDMIPPRKLEDFIKDKVIEIAPLAFMRGRTLSNAFVVLDEAQNTTVNQLKMFLTRMGINTKIIVTGDTTQIDLPRRSDSGLIQAMRILKGIDDIAIVELNQNDIVRHKLVRDIVMAYDQYNDDKYTKKKASNNKPGDTEENSR
jgi:phosphate starvation-inducible PhoH-like protein